MKKPISSQFLLVFFAGFTLVTSAFVFKQEHSFDVGKFKIKNGGDKSSNGTKTAYTQSAHDQTSPGTCSGCHNGGAVTPVVTLNASPAFGLGNTYTPGTVYTITYSVTGYSYFGFDLEMNDGNTVTSMTAGTLAAGTNSKYTANPYNQGFPSNITHNAKIPTGSAASFTWTAPSNGSIVYLFSNAVGVNGNSNDTGDRETFYNLILSPENAGLKEGKNTSSEFILFPNPSREAVNLAYHLVKTGRVKITAHDLSGKLVSEICEENQESGEHKLQFSTANFQAGTYFVHVEIDGETENYKFSVY